MASKPASLAAVMGPTNSYNGVPIATVTPPTYANPVPQNGNYQQFLANLQAAQAAANKQNQTDFGQALGLETQGFENQQQSIQQAIAAQAGYGASEQTQAQQQLGYNLGANASNMIGRGLGNTTIAQTSQAPIENAYNQQVAGISNQAANLQAGLYSNLASSESQGANSIANLLAQENNTPPNQALLAQLQQQANAGAKPTSITNFSGAQPPINSAGGGGQAPAGNSGIAPPKIPTVPPVPMTGPGAASNPAQGLNYTSHNGSQELPPSQFNPLPWQDASLPADSGGGNSPQANAQAGYTPMTLGNPSGTWNPTTGYTPDPLPQVGPGGGSAPDTSVSGGASITPGLTAAPPGAVQGTPPAQQQATQAPATPGTPAPAPINTSPGSEPAPSSPQSISGAMQGTQNPAGAWAGSAATGYFTQQQWQGLTPQQQQMVASGTPL